MSALSQMTMEDLEARDIQIRTRRKLLKEIAKWNELQNIVKYGYKPYLQSDGSEHRYPVSDQHKAELKQTHYPLKTGMFYAPFIDYKEMLRMLRNRNFNSAKTYTQQFITQLQQKNEQTQNEQEE